VKRNQDKNNYQSYDDVLSDHLLSNERTLKNMTLNCSEVDLHNLQLTSKLVSSPLTNNDK